MVPWGQCCLLGALLPADLVPLGPAGQMPAVHCSGSPPTHGCHIVPGYWAEMSHLVLTHISRTLFSCSSLDFLSSISLSFCVPSSTTSRRAMSSTSCQDHGCHESA